MQLSMTFLVTFVMAIIIFIGGIAIVRLLAIGSNENLRDVVGDLEAKLQELNCEDSVHCLVNQYQSVRGPKTFAFGVVVNNYQNEEVLVELALDTGGTKGVSRDNTPISVENDWITFITTTEEDIIARGERADMQVTLQIPKGSEIKPGTYHIPFDLTVYNDDNNDGFGTNDPNEELQTIRDRLTFTFT